MNALTTSSKAHDELKKVKKAKEVTEEEVDDEDLEALKKPKGAILTSEKVAKAVSDDPRYLGNRKRRKVKQQKLLDKFVRKEVKILDKCLRKQVVRNWLTSDCHQNTSYGYTEGKDHVVNTTSESNRNDAMLRTQYQSDDDGADELKLDENGDIIQNDKGQSTRVLRKANGADAQKGPNKTRKETTKIPRASVKCRWP